MRLITQPDEGIAPLLAAVKRAKRRLAIVIFRFDLAELEDALEAAVKRGVEVLALIAHIGSQSLRKLELDERREVGIIIRERKVVRKVEKVFNGDWKQATRKNKSD